MSCKAVRYAVTLDGDGYGIWELCEQWFEFGACRFELWCACLLLDGGPCRSRHSVHADLGVALALADSLEAEFGCPGGRVVEGGAPSVESAARAAELDSWSVDVPY